MTEYIERESLVAEFEWLKSVEHYVYRERTEDAIQRIKAAPAVDVAPVVHGEWEWETSDIYRCTVCNRKTHVEETMCQPAWQYCPNCGAKMDGDVNNG